MYDFLIVGAGFSGCVLAERIASQLDKRVLLVDSREHLGGLAYDFYNEAGHLVQKYGMHVFHTYSQEVIDYILSFTEWHHTDTRVCLYHEGRLLPFPINRETANGLFGLNLQTPQEAKAFFQTLPEPIPTPRNAEEMAINKGGRRLYEQIFRGYTLKWWGRAASELPITVTSRIKFRATLQDTYQNDPFQGTPKHGFTAMFKRMVAHKNITLQLGADYRAIADALRFDRMIYTGAIDDFFDNIHGRIPYRHMRYVHETLDQEYFQPCHQVNYPNDFPYMRTFEFKHATGQQDPKTTIIREYPMEAGPGMERHYPYPYLESNEIMQKYKREAQQLKSVKFIGRLADHKYYTMGQTVARALARFKTDIAPWVVTPS